MGTPGDKSNDVVREVVKAELSHELAPPPPQPPPDPVPLSSQPSSPYLLHRLLPIAVTAAPGISPPPDMGVIERRPPPRLPQAITAAAASLSFQELQQATSLAVPPSLSQIATSKPEQYHTQQLGLEQPTIEDYFQQSKFYPTASSVASTDYTVPTYQAAPSVKPRVPPFPEQPGPSGLHTPKQRSSTSATASSSSSSSASGSGAAKARKRPRPPLQRDSGTGESTVHGCRFCHKSFVSVEKLEKHQQTHTGSSPFKCENCKKTFTSKFKLVRHALIHSDRKPFSCSVCDRTFHRKDHLKNHIKVHSPQKEIYTCNKEGCKKQYTSFLSYRKHQAVHAAEEGNLTCQICSDNFKTKEEILYHLKIHAGSRTVKNPSERKFTCEFCDRRFFTKKDVRRHLVVHTGMRDFLCQFCPQRFGRKDHLVRHIKKSHNTKYKPAETVTTATVKIETLTSQFDSPMKPGEIEIKSEFSESSLSNPEAFTPSLVDFGFLGEDFSQLDSNLFLPSTSEQGELKDLGSAILEDIEGPSTSQTPGILVGENIETSQGSLGEVVLNDPELLQQLLDTPGDKNWPLPGFSQTFQSQQPPPPPGPPE